MGLNCSSRFGLQRLPGSKLVWGLMGAMAPLMLYMQFCVHVQLPC